MPPLVLSDSKLHHNLAVSMGGLERSLPSSQNTPFKGWLELYKSFKDHWSEVPKSWLNVDIPTGKSILLGHDPPNALLVRHWLWPRETEGTFRSLM